MTDITSSCTIEENPLAGGLKLVKILTPASAVTADTVDLNADVADGRGARVKTIRNVVGNTLTGASTAPTFVQSTGIVTVGNQSAQSILIFAEG